MHPLVETRGRAAEVNASVEPEERRSSRDATAAAKAGMFAAIQGEEASLTYTMANIGENSGVR
jgi:hypothetical protein